ncbi:hypothetical protein DIR46_24620 [Massilia oculi]|uniref:Twin-arginine translocation signal domain-containing protein n=1 Tax=Massilia oculi TaxID=945844 RepID=A0A2S2DPQ1_9BURK|nr:hypothetical protein DIR46_24620 [Massilia oculi]
MMRGSPSRRRFVQLAAALAAVPGAPIVSHSATANVGGEGKPVAGALRKRHPGRAVAARPGDDAAPAPGRAAPGWGRAGRPRQCAPRTLHQQGRARHAGAGGRCGPSSSSTACTRRAPAARATGSRSRCACTSMPVRTTCASFIPSSMTATRPGISSEDSA